MDRLQRPQDNLFESSTMTFGEHLEELRRSLGKAVIWLGIGLAVGLMFANGVIQFVQDPLREAILTFEAERTLARYGYDPEAEQTKVLRDFLIEEQLIVEQVLVVPMEDQQTLATKPPAATAIDAQSPAKPSENAPSTSGDAEPSESPTPAPADQGGTEAEAATVTPKTASSRADKAEEPSQPAEPTGRPVPETEAPETEAPETDEATADPLFEDLNAATLQEMLPQLDRFQRQFQLRPSKAGLNSHKTEEGFMIWIKAGLLVGAVLASPMIFYHIWTFVGAGLYAHERKYVYVYLPFSVLLFASGVCLAFFLVLHYVLNFLLNFNAGMDVDFQPRLSYYMNFVLLLPLGFGIAFQLPLVMLFLQRIGIFETQAYIDSWRIAVLVISILSMILTPADITSMIALAVPLCLLYGLGILMCRYIPRGRGLGSQALDPS